MSIPLGIRFLGSLPGYDNNIYDVKQQEVIIKQPDKTMYRKTIKIVWWNSGWDDI